MKKINTALLIVDIQNDYFEGGSNPLVGSIQAAKNAALILNGFRSSALPVIHIQHIASSPTATFFLPNTRGAEIHESVKPAGNEKVIVKHYPNSFRGTGLLDYLKSENISSLVVCGMMTHMCIDATVRAAKDHGFGIELIGDACATKNLDINGTAVAAADVHNSFLAALSYFYATVKTTGEFLQQL